MKTETSNDNHISQRLEALLGADDAFLVTEALHTFLGVKQEALKVLQEAHTGGHDWRPEDFAIPRIERLIRLFSGEDESSETEGRKVQGYSDGQKREIVAQAFWQNLHDTILGNRRKRKPEWIINFAFSHIAYNDGSTGSLNERMTRQQAAALCDVLTRALAADPEKSDRFRVTGDMVPRCGRAI